MKSTICLILLNYAALNISYAESHCTSNSILNANYYSSYIDISVMDELLTVLPGSIPPDTVPIEDTLEVTGVFKVSELSHLIFDGLDTIRILQEDTTIYTSINDTLTKYLIGEVVNGITFTKPNDTLNYYYSTDTAEYFIPRNDTVVYS